MVNGWDLKTFFIIINMSTVSICASFSIKFLNFSPHGCNCCSSPCYYDYLCTCSKQNDQMQIYTSTFVFNFTPNKKCVVFLNKQHYYILLIHKKVY